MSSKLYKILYNDDVAMCIGVTDVIVGGGAVLCKTSERHTTWSIDMDAGTILLDASGAQLALTYVSAGTQLTLTAYDVKGPTDAQRWDFNTRPGFILSAVDASMAIDLSGRIDKGQNVIQAYAWNGSPAQRWNKSAVEAVRTAQVATAK